MIVLRGHPYEWEVPAPTAVTVGVFDGVHLGHRRVISDLVASAGELEPAVLTFDPHPLAILRPERAPKMLTDIEQRLDQFRALRIRVVGILEFPHIRDLTAEEFSERVLARALAARRVVVGADFRFGRDRGGDSDMLVEAGPSLGFEVEVVDMLGTPEGVVSSTRIRHALIDGQIDEANQMLARPYELTGTVEQGDRRGQQIGFPTANLGVSADRLIPANGVYAAWAVVGGVLQKSVVNIGIRPTFSGKERKIEAHLLDWNGDLYDRAMGLRLVKRIRAERKFESIDNLVDQIQNDVEAARQILGDAKVGSVPHDSQV